MLKPLQTGRGFTLIELAVAIAVLSILTLAAAPALTSWVGNAQVRSVADGILNGLHLAQAEAARRNRQVSFILTNSPPNVSASVTPNGSGVNWVIVTVPSLLDVNGNSEGAQLVQGSTLTNVASGTVISGPATLTFNSYGLVTNGTGTNTYQITKTTADHPLNVTVSTGGQIRTCDATKTLATSPEGC